MSARTCGHVTYLAGCGTCQTERRVYNKRHARDVQRHGPQKVPSGPLVAALRYARAAGLSNVDIAELTGMSERNVGRLASGLHPFVYRRNRDLILKALAGAAAARRTALDDLCSAVEYARGQGSKSDGLWPTAALLQKITEQFDGLYATPLGRADIRYLYRSDVLDTARADRMCIELGIEPERVWPDWFRFEEAG